MLWLVWIPMNSGAACFTSNCDLELCSPGCGGSPESILSVNSQFSLGTTWHILEAEWVCSAGKEINLIILNRAWFLNQLKFPINSRMNFYVPSTRLVYKTLGSKQIHRDVRNSFRNLPGPEGTLPAFLFSLLCSNDQQNNLNSFNGRKLEAYW